MAENYKTPPVQSDYIDELLASRLGNLPPAELATFAHAWSALRQNRVLADSPDEPTDLHQHNAVIIDSEPMSVSDTTPAPAATPAEPQTVPEPDINSSFLSDIYTQSGASMKDGGSMRGQTDIPTATRNEKRIMTDVDALSAQTDASDILSQTAAGVKGKQQPEVRVRYSTGLPDAASSTAPISTELLTRGRIIKGASIALAATIAIPPLADGVIRVAHSAGKDKTTATSCVDATHQMMEVGNPIGNGPLNLIPKPVVQEARHILAEAGIIHTNETWTNAAAYLSDMTGYHISPERLRDANPTAYEAGSKTPTKQVQTEANGHVSDAIAASGEFCYNVPPPIVSGQIEANGKMSLAAYAKEYSTTPQALRKLNPNAPAKDDQPLPGGYVVWTADQKKLNTSLVLRPLTEESPAAAAHGDYKLMSEIATANSAKISQEGGVKKGDLLYLPPIQGKAPTADKVTLSEAIIKADKQSYTQAGRDQQPAPKPTTTSTEGVSNPPADSPTPSPKEAPTSGANTPADFTGYQQDIIDHLPNLNKTQRANLAAFTQTILKMQKEGKLDGINPTVMLAQAICESGWGESELATKANNFFGNKANGGWTGDKILMPTHEQSSSGQTYSINDYFRKYPTMEAGFQDYVDKIQRPGSPYHDAMQQEKAHPNDPRAYIKGLENELNPDGSIKVARKMAYATEHDYESILMNIIGQYRLDDLIKGNHPVEIGPATAGNIKLDPSKYSANQKALPGNPSNGAWVVLPNGTKVLSKKLSYDQRLQIVQDWLNKVQVSPEGYNQFVSSMQDMTQTIPKRYSNFDGHFPNLHGIPTLPQDIKYFVFHFTSTDTSASGMDGDHAASSMQNAGHDIGIQYFTNDKGQVYHLTNYRTYHTLRWADSSGKMQYYNEMAFGNEIAAPEQAGVNNLEYQAAIYTAVNFLINNHYISKSTPDAGKVVDDMFRGHRELNPTGHEDNPKIVMDQVRAFSKQLLVQLGYNVPSLQQAAPAAH